MFSILALCVCVCVCVVDLQHFTCSIYVYISTWIANFQRCIWIIAPLIFYGSLIAFHFFLSWIDTFISVVSCFCFQCYLNFNGVIQQNKSTIEGLGNSNWIACKSSLLLVTRSELEQEIQIYSEVSLKLTPHFFSGIFFCGIEVSSIWHLKVLWLNRF